MRINSNSKQFAHKCHRESRRLSNAAIVMTSGSSVGTQPKYYDNGYWYKRNSAGYEGTAEYLCSLVLSCSNEKNFVKYEPCTIYGLPGCRSKSFLKTDESFISFQRLYEMYTGGDLSDTIRSVKKVEDRIRLVTDFILDYSGVDCTEYLSNILSLDLLTLNTDRHFHNLGIIVHRNEKLSRPAPIFDNGDALLSNYGKFDKANSLSKNIVLAYAQPFSSSHATQAHKAGITLRIDKKKLLAKLQKEPASRAKEVLLARMTSPECAVLF